MLVLDPPPLPRRIIKQTNDKQINYLINIYTNDQINIRIYNIYIFYFVRLNVLQFFSNLNQFIQWTFNIMNSCIMKYF